MANPCLGREIFGCTAEVIASHESGFCQTCEDRIRDECIEGDAAMEQFTRLGAEFDLWCAQHGLPDPHS